MVITEFHRKSKINAKQIIRYFKKKFDKNYDKDTVFDILQRVAQVIN